MLNKYFKIIELWNCKVRYRLKCVFDHKKRDICETKYMSFCEEKKENLFELCRFDITQRILYDSLQSFL